MAFETFSDFLAMGKHGPFVWSAYGIFALVLIINIIAPIQRKRALVSEIKRKIKREKLES